MTSQLIQHLTTEDALKYLIIAFNALLVIYLRWNIIELRLTQIGIEITDKSLLDGRANCYLDLFLLIANWLTLKHSQKQLIPI